jgi:hypothetical protein
VAQYCIVDPDANSVDVWGRACGAAEPQSYTAPLPVRLGDLAPGAIELAEIFPPELKD